MVRLKDIAKAAGVSTGTVSAALSGTGRIGPETRESIRRLAHKMDYRPNAAARMLRSKPVVDAGMIIADEQVMLVPYFTNWCEQYHLRHQLELISSAGTQQPTLFNDNFAAGTLHVGFLGETVRRFLSRNPEFPFVAVNEKYKWCVRSNFATGAREALQYLTALGHRSISLSVGDLVYDLHQQLERGLAEAVREFHFDTTPEIRHLEVRGITHDKVMQRCVERARAILRERPRPTAFFCSGMLEARAFIYAGLELGLTAPKDFSVVAVGGRLDAESGYPAITTLGNDYGQLVTQSMLLLQRRISGLEETPRDILVDTKLDIRNSSGKVPE
ncbi:MAG: LacI family DNA-binding transcriptional regulator [Lentisphaeria bacterium]|nr:LacI family DNA-binding transcriptional regulator [Lentisphaeria bacterium]